MTRPRPNVVASSTKPDSLAGPVGYAVVACPKCSVERWYGYGMCECGSYLADAPVPQPRERKDLA